MFSGASAPAPTGRSRTTCLTKSVLLGRPFVSGYTYRWDALDGGPPVTNPTSAQTTVRFTEAGAFRYQLTVLPTMGSNDCELTDTVTVQVLPVDCGQFPYDGG